MISLNEIRKKIMSGDISSLLHISRENNIHPSEVAKLFNELLIDTTLHAFQLLFLQKQVLVFFLSRYFIAKKILRGLGKERATYILNKLSSDDRLTLINSYKGVERMHILELLEDKNKKATHDMLGYPKESVARLINTRV